MNEEIHGVTNKGKKKNSYEWMEKWYKYDTKHYNNKNTTKS